MSSKGIKGKRVTGDEAGSYGLHNWNLGLFEDLDEEAIAAFEKAVGRTFDRMLTLASEEYPARIEYDPTVEDPSQILIDLPLGEWDDFGGPQWHFSLSEFVNDFIYWIKDDSRSIQFEQGDLLATELRTLAEKIEQAMQYRRDEDAKLDGAGAG